MAAKKPAQAPLPHPPAQAPQPRVHKTVPPSPDMFDPAALGPAIKSWPKTQANTQQGVV